MGGWGGGVGGGGEAGQGDWIAWVAGLGRERPLLAWPMTLAMLGLAGIPATAGLIGKIYLIEAAVEGGYAWLGVVIVVGSMISLGYYLPVIATMWMRGSPAAASARGDSPSPPITPAPEGRPLPTLAGGSPELADPAEPEPPPRAGGAAAPPE